MILLSPTKTMSVSKEPIGTTPLFEEDANAIMMPLQDMDEKTLSDYMKIKGNVLKQTKAYIEGFAQKQYPAIAIEAYQGIGYRCLDVHSLDRQIVDQKILILSAVYGVLKPTDVISCYRMDFVINHHLYHHWKPLVSTYLKQLDVPYFYCLASLEYEAMIDQKSLKQPIIQFQFIQNGKKAPSSIAKQARGTMAHLMILNNAFTHESVQQLCPMNFVYDASASTTTTFVYRRMI